MLIEDLSDKELAALNACYPWACGTKDKKGRILGCHDKLYPVPHPRVTAADAALGLSGKSVVEFGCLDGCHTISIAERAKSLVAIDFQPGNLERSRVRCELYGASADFRLINLESAPPPEADLFFHSGVLYHLTDPISHLERIAPLCRELFLDTHHTRKASLKYKAANGLEYPCQVHGEPKDPRAGAGGFSRWLPLSVIMGTLQRFFSKAWVLEDKDERHGPRVSIAARKE